MISTLSDLLAWALLVVPMMILSWASIWLVKVQAERNRYERYQRFYAIMEQLGRKDGSTADKMAAAYELRNYREYADIISKIFGEGYMRDDTGEILQSELKATIEHVTRTTSKAKKA